MRLRLVLAAAVLLGVGSLLRAQGTAVSPADARVWLGHEAELEQYLKTAPVDHVEKVPVGVTKPRRAFFEPGGPVASAVVKVLPPGRSGGFFESYQSEIAAYVVDRLLGLGMVPVTVERHVGPDLASVQLWVEGCRGLRQVDQSACPDQTRWALQVCRQRVFDNLIANIDRNEGNILVDANWDMILIDHSRAFAMNKMPFEKQMTRIDREFFDRLKALDEATLMERLKPWVLGKGDVRSLLKRRDRIVARFEALAREKGEAAVFPF
jgi:hypothetical protein